MLRMSLIYSRLPAWLEQAWIFRKLLLLRKLFLTRRSFRHYSQFAEDVSVLRYFPGASKGFFVDVGCVHLIKYNNTYQLYRRGWRGINIDLDPIKIEGFNLVRRRDVNLVCAVSNQTQEVSYWSNGFYSLTSTLDKSFAQQRPGYVEKKVRTETLTAIVDKSRFKDRKIDFLSVDAEGHNLEVLQ